jgi:hypothetical protein
MFDEIDEPRKVDRSEDGRWKKGTRSPNPRGYTRADRLAREDVKEAARRLTPKALRTLERVMDNPKAPDSAKVQAASVLMDRAWGKTAVDGPEQTGQITIRWLGQDDESNDPLGERARLSWEGSH